MINKSIFFLKGSMVICFFLFFITCVKPVFAQVGINNINPDPSAVLDLKAPDKGLLIPRMTTDERNNIIDPAESLLVYDTDFEMFFFFKNGGWFIVNPWVAEVADDTNPTIDNYVLLSGNVGIGVAAPSEKLEVAGKIKADDISLNNGSGVIPVGGIIMWSGAVADIPEGWALCDGNNGTPNLVDRFVVGAGGSYTVNNQGGSDYISLTQNEMPRHSHGPGTLNIISSGTHSHTSNAPKKQDKIVSKNSGKEGEKAQNHDVDNATISGNGTHVHPSSSFRGATAETGSGNAFDNRPRYWALAYIMKVAN